jgi:hypothetical protein
MKWKNPINEKMPFTSILAERVKGNAKKRTESHKDLDGALLLCKNKSKNAKYQINFSDSQGA